MIFKECTIIVKSEKDKKEFLKACRHIHDFTVWIDKLSSKQRKKIRTQDDFDKPKKKLPKDTIGICLNHEKYPFINFMAHLADCDDPKTSDKYIKVKKSK